MARKLTVDERNMVDAFVRRYGAANLDVSCRRNKSSVTVGFRVFEANSANDHIESAFRIPLDEFPVLPEIISQIDSHLNACIDDPTIAQDKPVAPVPWYVVAIFVVISVALFAVMIWVGAF